MKSNWRAIQKTTVQRKQWLVTCCLVFHNFHRLNRFSGIEDRIDEYECSRSSGETPSNVSNFEIRMNELEENVQEIRSQVNVQCTQPVSHDVISNMSEPSCSTGYPDLTHLAEVANEL